MKKRREKKDKYKSTSKNLALKTLFRSNKVPAKGFSKFIAILK